MNISPFLNPGVYVYVVVPFDYDDSALTPLATIREREGLTMILPEAEATGLEPRFRAAWITLEVKSQLDDVGLTAAFATALARARISCNVVAGTHHDHLFVPYDQAEAAMQILRSL